MREQLLEHALPAKVVAFLDDAALFLVQLAQAQLLPTPWQEGVQRLGERTQRVLAMHVYRGEDGTPVLQDEAAPPLLRMSHYLPMRHDSPGALLREAMASFHGEHGYPATDVRLDISYLRALCREQDYSSLGQATACEYVARYFGLHCVWIEPNLGDACHIICPRTATTPEESPSILLRDVGICMPQPVTLIVPYYSQPLMLARQLAEWNQYPPEVQVILVDDGSPEPALPVVQAHASAELLTHLRLYQIVPDVPWNRGMVRNLGATEAHTNYIVQIDTDHILPAVCIPSLLAFQPSSHRLYRFSRYRVGQADETRMKDALPRECVFGSVKPHIDSYLIHRDLFLKNCYDEDYSGCLGGGSAFLARMEKRAPVELLPESISLHVYTRASIPDASISTLSRDTSEYARRRREKERTGNTAPGAILRLPWTRIL